MRKHFSAPQILVLLAATLSACSSFQPPAQLQPSGFLGDSQSYSLMKPDASIPGVLVYKTSPQVLSGYDSYIVPPVSVVLNQDGRVRSINKDDMQELAQKFRSEVIASLGNRYQVIDVPASRVAILRLAITDANPNVVLMNLPVVSLITGGGLGGASMEAELLDSVTGRRIATVMASSVGKSHSFTSSMTTWGETDAVLADWAKVIALKVT